MGVLKALVPYLDEIMAVFYREILSHEQMAVFFKDDEHIKQLIKTQKKNLIDSLEDDDEAFKARYMRLGELHFDLRVPNVDFLRSTNILRTNFIDFAVKELDDIHLIEEIETYFRQADVYMCKGFLARQLSVDKADLEALISQYQQTESLNIDIGRAHLKWLYSILIAIEAGDSSLVPGLDIEECTAHTFLTDTTSTSSSPFSFDHLDDLHHRVHIDAKNLFYFIEKNDYPEVLSLYSSLLGVYKITLIFLGSHSLQVVLNETKAKLENATETIKTLEGLIPICSYCHKVRNDAGSWDRLEAYIQKHTDTDFSHGICPTCYEKPKSSTSKRKRLVENSE